MYPYISRAALDNQRTSIGCIAIFRKNLDTMKVCREGGWESCHHDFAVHFLQTRLEHMHIVVYQRLLCIIKIYKKCSISM